MWVDVYDFDGTVYKGDATRDFWRYCLWHKPALIKHLPRQIAALCMMATRGWNLTKGKSTFLCFFQDIDVEAMAKAFWASPRVQRRMMPWFAPRQSELPVVIASASPEVILAPMAWKVGAHHLIGTRVQTENGRLEGCNCKGQEKVERLQALLPGVRIRAMYTDDTRADGPLLALAQQKYHVRGKTPHRIYG